MCSTCVFDAHETFFFLLRGLTLLDDHDMVIGVVRLYGCLVDPFRPIRVING